MRQLPNERIIYFGDTARVPYGPKSPDTVLRYSREITSTCVTGREGARRRVQHRDRACAAGICARRIDLPIVGVIEPGRAPQRADAKRSSASSARRDDRLARLRAAIAAIAPNATIGTRLSALRAARRGRVARYRSDAADRGEYLAPSHERDVDTLVLGCTHYPLLKDRHRNLGRDVRLIDSAAGDGAETARRSARRGLLA